jgi:16S rRNA (adenine1518-N6/adenine1519-N6)-dimethyltransferase
MFQKEVARRITAPPGGRDYGVLTLMSAARASSELLLDVNAASFSPVPAVDSSVLLFRPRLFFPQRADEDAFRVLVKKSFSHRRKTLINSLGLCGVEKSAVSGALEGMGLKQTVRPQELSLEHFAALSTALGGGLP